MIVLTKRQKRIREQYTKLIRVSPRRVAIDLVVIKQTFPLHPRTWPKAEAEYIRDMLAIALSRVR